MAQQGILTDNVNEVLKKAVENCSLIDTDEVKNLLATKKSFFSQDILDQCLLLSCQNGNVLFICALLSAGANIESVDDNGNTSLSLCALHSHPHCARLLLSAGANINTANYNGDTPLILSAFVHASLEMLKILLIKKDIDREHTNKKGKTALMCAVESVNVSAIKLLMDAGADYETKLINHEDLVFTNNELNNIVRRKGIFNLLNLFKSEVAKKESAFLGAVLNRDLNSVQLLACMDHSLLDTNQMTLIDVILEFLKSIQKQNNAVSETEIEIFKLLLHYTQLDPQKVGDNHKIMHVAVSIGSVTLIELLSHRKFVISNEALGFAVFNPTFLQFLLSSSYLKADAIVQRTVPNYFGLSYPIYKGSALEKAMQGEQMISVKCLIQHGAYLNVYEALKFAIENSHESAVRFILQEYGGEALEKINCCGFLLSAVKNSSINIIKDLLNHGGDVNLIQYCVCPLTSALNVNKIDLLLSKGADVNLEIKISEFYRQSYTFPLHFFVSRGFKDVLKKECLSKNLIDLDTLESFLNSETENIIRSLLRHGAHVNAKDSSCFTPLHRAAQRKNSSGIIKLLISSGAQVNGEYIRGVGAIHLAVESHCVENVRCLLEAGADVNSISVATGRNAVFDAKDYNILKLLLDHQADVNLRDNDGYTPLILALKQGVTDEKYLKLLIQVSCDFNCQCPDGYSPIFYAAKYYIIEVLKILVNSGAKVNLIVNKPENYTAILMLLVRLWNHTSEARDILQYLLNHGAIVTCNHSAIVHVLISCGCLSLVSRLISQGLCPVEIKAHKLFDSGFCLRKCISPLDLALLLDVPQLAEYFIKIRFLRKSDISLLSRRIFLRYRHLRHLTEGENFLKSSSHNPLSLETLCFVTISDMLGSTHDRKVKVENLGLPIHLQDSLLFKNVPPFIVDVARKHVSSLKASYEQLKFFKASLEDLNLRTYFEDKNIDHYYRRRGRMGVW